jgi:acyl carrier protein
VLVVDTLKEELKRKIIQTLDLVDLTPEDIADDAQLVGGDFGIDSIDVLELVIMIEQEYGVSIDSKAKGTEVFSSINALAEHIETHRKK